jgi:hypothetical protein
MKKKITHAKIDYVVKCAATAFGFFSAGLGLVAGIEFCYWPAWVLLGLGLFAGISALCGIAEEREVEEDV